MVRRGDDHREQAARAVVAAHLRMHIAHHDDQTKPRMHDLELHFPDGRWAAIEVTAAEDRTLAEQHGALKGRRSTLRHADLRFGWLAHLAEGVNVRHAKSRLPELLAAFEDAGLTEVSAGSMWLDEELEWATERLAEAQVMAVQQWPTEPGMIHLLLPMRMGFMSRDPEDVVSFVEEFVARRPSDVRKLADTEADERHLFIWSGYYSEGWPSLRALQLDVAELPRRSPVLPPAVTHVWVANEWAPPSRILHFSPEQGWVQVGQTSSTT